jgi:hypothetical protein
MTTFTTPASVSGVAQEGQLLTALGEVDDPMATITYQWQENISGNWTDIPGETNPTYTVIEADEGNALRVVETATDGGTPAMSTSDPTAAVTDITLAFTSGASIDNTAPREGDTLSASMGRLMTPTLSLPAISGSGASMVPGPTSPARRTRPTPSWGTMARISSAWSKPRPTLTVVHSSHRQVIRQQP